VGELKDILHELEASVGSLSGEPAPLDGGITNRNFRVRLGGEDYVLRLPGKDTELLGIDRDAERIANAAAAEIAIAPDVIASAPQFLLTRFIECDSLGAEQVAERVEEIAAALSAFHESGVLLPTSFSVPLLLGEYARIVAARGGTLPRGYARAVLAAAQVHEALGAFDERPCHNDLLPSNLIAECSGGRTMIVDWEYAGMGDPRFDLGNLAVNNGFDEAAERRLLGAYGGGAASDRELAGLRLMRVLSDAREGAWGAVQGVASELDFDFAAYADEHFERLDATVASDDFQEWLAAARG